MRAMPGHDTAVRLINEGFCDQSGGIPPNIRLAEIC